MRPITVNYNCIMGKCNLFKRNWTNKEFSVKWSIWKVSPFFLYELIATYKDFCVKNNYLWNGIRGNTVNDDTNLQQRFLCRFIHNKHFHQHVCIPWSWCCCLPLPTELQDLTQVKTHHTSSFSTTLKWTSIKTNKYLFWKCTSESLCFS